MQHDDTNPARGTDGSARGGARGIPGIALTAVAVLGTAGLSGALAATQTGSQDRAEAGGNHATLDETRLALGKWIETQQIISKEQIDWQQGREILVGRLELVKQEIATLEQKIGEARSELAAGEAKRTALAVEDAELQSQQARLGAAATELEGLARSLVGALPQPVREKLAPLVQRMPEQPAETKATAAERFQNVLGILNEVDKANSEIAVVYEVRTLSDGKRSEVKALYVGLGQAYYVSASGEAGIGRPSIDGWEWEQADALADDVLRALEILQGKHTPAFVPLPARIQ
jgi:hypothetical protein